MIDGMSVCSVGIETLKQWETSFSALVATSGESVSVSMYVGLVLAEH